MSEPNDEFIITPPPFDADAALVQLKRSLRELRGLAERSAGFDWKGQAVISLAVEGPVIRARLAKRPARSPEWETRPIKSATDLRSFGDEVKRRVARWRDADE